MTGEVDVSVPFLSLRRPAVPGSVREIRGDVRAFALRHGADAEALTAIELAVSEAAANAVPHGRANGRGTVRVEADVEEGELEAVILDDGAGFADGEPDDAPPRLGLGLALMRQGASAFEIRDRPEGGMEVWMRFAMPA